MLIVKVKICGITNFEDAKATVDFGANIIGFNFYPKSPRYISPEDAAKIIYKLPAFVDTAAIFVNEPEQKIKDTLEICPLNWIQLHGDETPEFCQSLTVLSVKTMKAIRVKDKSDINRANDYLTDAVLLDAYHPEKYGGTGITFDWNIVGNLNKRVFLAGGINPDNIRAAVELGVYGIDVCSGVETSPGKKDHEKMKLLLENIKDYRG